MKRLSRMICCFVPVILSAGVGGAQMPGALAADINQDGIVDYQDLFLFHRDWLVDQRPVIPVSLPGGVTMEFVRIAAGSFVMGSTDGADWSYCHPCEQPPHPVDIAYDFYIGRCEVTQAQWVAVMGSNPASDFGVGHDYPVYNVSWEDGQNFIAQVNQLGQGTFRLPSEAEWEYACRAGTMTRFSFGDSICSPTEVLPCELDNYGWWINNSADGAEPVRQLLPNAFGLYDMHGNVNEWCEDDWHEDYSGAPADGSAWVETPRVATRVFRGGHWNYEARYSRSAVRAGAPLAASSDLLGLRLVRQAQ